MSAFSVDIAEFVKKAGARADLVARKVGIEVFSSVVRKTPVDSGRARANWVASVGAPSVEITGALDAGHYGSEPSGASAAKAQAVLNDFTIGPAIFITNSLPYIERLENGYSDQAPAGMVAITAIEYQKFVADAVKSLP